jgi:CBS domain containing-hemolysin-like protein
MVTGLIAAMVLVLANGFFVAAELVLARIRSTHAAGTA